MRNILLAFFCSLLTIFTVHAQDIDTRKWMETLPDSALMIELSIPATHDSGAMHGGFALKTQDATIRTQLDQGIRGFDIRLQPYNQVKLGVYHDVKFQKITWEDDVLPALIDFLKKNPSETLWVSLKKEGGDTESYCELISKSLQDAEIQKYLVKHVSAEMTLGECRGKILFIHRDTYLKKFPGMQCHRWPDNLTGSMIFQTEDGTILNGMVEDQYGYHSGKKAQYKAELTWTNMQRAMNAVGLQKIWHISFASATALPWAGPAAFAKVVNPFIEQKTASIHKPCGVVLVDFAATESVQKLIANLIRSNQKYFINR